MHKKLVLLTLLLLLLSGCTAPTIIEEENIDIEQEQIDFAEQEETPDFKTECEKNAKQFPADSVASFEGSRFSGMDYYYKGNIVDVIEIDNNVGDPKSWLVENERGYLMPIQFEYFNAEIGDVVEVWGTLSGNMYDLGSIGYEGIINKVGSMHAMLVTVNGEQQY